MNNFFIIPFTINPPIKTYPGYAYVLSLLFAKSKGHFPWLFNHYIQALGNGNGTRYEFMPSDPFHVSEGVVEYMSTSLFPDMLYDNRIFYNVVTAMLRNGYGMLCGMNERYIPNRRAYQRYDFWHDNMVVGYNDMEKTLLVLGYSPIGQYSVISVPLEQIITSLTISKQSALSLSFMKPSSTFYPSFRYNIVLEEIENYLEARSIEELGYSEFYGVKQWKTGIEATNNLLLFPIEEKGHFDLRLYSFLRDRVTLMYQRTRYMMDNGYLPHRENMLSELLYTVKLAESVHLMAIKYNLQGKPHYVTAIRDNIEQIVNIEKTALPWIINN